MKPNVQRDAHRPQWPRATVNHLTSGSVSTASGRLRYGTWPKWAGLLLLFASFLLIHSAGCGDDQIPADDSSELTAFPRHDYPLGTDKGGDYFAGQLVLRDGCLRVEVPSDDSDDLALSSLVIWPSTHTVEKESGTVRIIDGLGQTAAQVGDHIRLSSAAVPYEEAKRRELVTGLSEHCLEPPSSILVGDEVSVFDPENEATELRLSDPEVLFFRQETEMSVNRLFMEAAGIGELVLDGPCFTLNGSTTILWPAGFTPHVEDGVVEVRNGAGKTIARVGDEIAGGGGGSKRKHKECPGGMFKIHDVKVLPDVEVYFPQWDDAIRMGQVTSPRTGELALDGKCLGLRRILDGGVPEHALLLWPEAYDSNVENGAVEVLDATGRVVARLGDEVQVNAFDVTYGQAKKHGGLEPITPGCWAPYWAVEEIFAVTETP